MRIIEKPILKIEDVFNACAGSIQKKTTKERILGINKYIRGSHIVYRVHAFYGLLYVLGDEHDKHPSCTATKEELVNLYEQQLVKTKAGRKHYDAIIDLAPLGKCPFCGFGIATTLDHYMPKQKYPSFSISPLNLIPSCSDCNTGKNDDVASSFGEQGLHPYFDHQLIQSEQWLYADVNKGTGINYYVRAPSSWDVGAKERIKSHFKNFKLGFRFSTEAIDQLSCLRETLNQYCSLLGKEGVRNHLNIEAKTHYALHKNSWKTAMYQALASSDWYCDGGFNEG